MLRNNKLIKNIFLKKLNILKIIITIFSNTDTAAHDFNLCNLSGVIFDDTITVKRKESVLKFVSGDNGNFLFRRKIYYDVSVHLCD
jgi:hypothetical protein